MIKNGKVMVPFPRPKCNACHGSGLSIKSVIDIVSFKGEASPKRQNAVEQTLCGCVKWKPYSNEELRQMGYWYDEKSGMLLPLEPDHAEHKP